MTPKQDMFFVKALSCAMVLTQNITNASKQDMTIAFKLFVVPFVWCWQRVAAKFDSGPPPSIIALYSGPPLSVISHAMRVILHELLNLTAVRR